MKSLFYRPVADDAGNFLPWVLALRNQSGAYIIRNAASGQILYVGESHSGCLGKVLKRHFYPWKDTPERKHYTYQKGRVEVAIRLCPPPAAVSAQNRLIQRMLPRDNSQGFEPDPF